MRLWLAGMLLLAPTAAAAVEPWSLVRLDLELRITVDPPALAMSGRARVRAEADSAGPAFAINTRARIVSLQSVRSNGAEATIRPFRDGSPIEVAELRLPRVVTKGETIDVEFSAIARQASSQFVIGSDSMYASWVESWYPRPAISETALAPPAVPGSTTFRMPARWRSVSNGKLISRRETDGEIVEVWATEEPLARSFVAAPFAVAESVEAEGHAIGTFLLKSRPHIRAQAVALAKSVAAMERRFGPFPYESFHIVEVPEKASFAAGSEQGFIMVRASLLDAQEGNLPLFAHEAAHAWWGNLVRTDGPGGSMLSEAAAQYGALLSIEAVEGEAAARHFLRFSRAGYNPLQCALGFFYIWREGGDKPLTRLGRDRWDHNLADAKGHWFYHMVRRHLGDARFFGALRAILRDFATKEATVEDLRRAFLSAGADAHFLSQWLDRTGAPVLRVDWWSADRGRGIEIEIEQRGEPFELPLELAIETESGTVTKTVQLCGRNERFFIGIPARPLAVRIDPNDNMLVWRPEYGPPPI